MMSFVKPQKLLQAEHAIPISVKDPTQNHKFSIMRAKFVSFTNWHGQDMMLMSEVCTNFTN